MLTRYRLALAALVILTPYVGACGADLPAQHPVGDLSSRASARLGLISLIIKDETRAQKVVALHEELTALAPQFNRKRAVKIAELASIIEESPEDFKEAVLEVRHDEVATYARYRTLMFELRALVTPEEYRRLMAIR